MGYKAVLVMDVNLGMSTLKVGGDSRLPSGFPPVCAQFMQCKDICGQTCFLRGCNHTFQSICKVCTGMLAV